MATERTLHLLDVEYLGCGPALSAEDLERVLARYRPRVDWHVGDIAIGAASTWTYKRLAFDLPPGLRLLPAGGGPDAADLRLIDEAHVIDLTRYDRIVIASGDHAFVDLAQEIHQLDLEVWAAGYSFSTSGRLRAAVDRVVELDGYGLAA